MHYLNKYVVSIAPFSTPACPDCSQNIFLNCSFCMFSLFNISSIFRGSAGPICPYVRTPVLFTLRRHFDVSWQNGPQRISPMFIRQNGSVAVPAPTEYRQHAAAAACTVSARGCQSSWRVQLLLIHRPIDRYRRSKHRNSVSSLNSAPVRRRNY